MFTYSVSVWFGLVDICSNVHTFEGTFKMVVWIVRKIQYRKIDQQSVFDVCTDLLFILYAVKIYRMAEKLMVFRYQWQNLAVHRILIGKQ